MQLFTPNQLFVHSIRHENPYSDSPTSNYGGITSLLNIPFPHAHTPIPRAHTHLPPNTTSTTNWNHSQYQDAPSTRAALFRSPASPALNTGGGAPAHAKAVTATPLFGSAAFYAQTTFRPSIRHENPNSDLTNSNYGGITSLLNTPFPHAHTHIPGNTTSTTSLHTPSPPSPTYARPETAPTQRLQRRLHSNLPRHERARRDRLLAETSLLRPPTFRVDHAMSGPR